MPSVRIHTKMPAGDAPARDPVRGGRGRTASLLVLVCSGITSLVLLSFFLVGLADGSVSSFNMGLWLALLAIAGLSTGAGYALRARGRFGLAIAALSVTAMPGLLAAVFLLTVLLTDARWN